MLTDIELNELHTNQRLLIIEMQKRKIDVSILDKDMELIEAIYGKHKELILDRDSSITPYTESIVAGDKFITKRLLERENISVPKGDSFFFDEIENAKQYSKELGYPVVVKPSFGSHGDNVFMNVKDESDLENCINTIIKDIGKSKDYIIEEQFDGKEYRVFVTKNGDYAVLYREPAYVIGNGKNTIKELIDIENKKRKERINCLCPISTDNITIRCLKMKKLSLDFIPNDNEKVYVRTNSNLAKGGVCEDYTNRTHKTVIEICKKILEVFPGLHYIGVDFMTKDITKEQDKNSYRIIEVNTVPGIHMHMRPSIGEPQNVAKYMVDMIFPETKEQKNGKS